MFLDPPQIDAAKTSFDLQRGRLTPVSNSDLGAPHSLSMGFVGILVTIEITYIVDSTNLSKHRIVNPDNF